MYDVEVGQLGQFLSRVPKHSTERGVYLAKAPIESCSRHSERALLKYPSKPLLALAQRPFRAFPTGDVPPIEACHALRHRADAHPQPALTYRREYLVVGLAAGLDSTTEQLLVL